MAGRDPESDPAVAPGESTVDQNRAVNVAAGGP